MIKETIEEFVFHKFYRDQLGNRTVYLCIAGNLAGNEVVSTEQFWTVGEALNSLGSGRVEHCDVTLIDDSIHGE
jgi:hypothetical protein